MAAVIIIFCLIVIGALISVIIASRIENSKKEVAREDLHNQEANNQEEAAADNQEESEEQGETQDNEEPDEWNLILVNNQNAIPEGYEVETAETEDGYLVDARIKDPLEKMLEDCRAEGHSPQIISAFRTHETQQYLYDTTANKADTAVPGHSEHECGLAVDIIDSKSAGWADPLIKEQEDLAAQKWLMENCHKYGFILRYPEDKEEITEIIYEPWHYRYVGVEHAKEIMVNKICLEEYIEELNGQ